jgi:hypothetical protein
MTRGHGLSAGRPAADLDAAMRAVGVAATIVEADDRHVVAGKVLVEHRRHRLEGGRTRRSPRARTGVRMYFTAVEERSGP